jgi:hypothetical protein
MTNEQQKQLYDALHHGVTGRDELDVMCAVDVEAIEPLIDRWIREARDYYFEWAQHKPGCVFTGKLGPCPCGLFAAIERRNR